MGHPVVPVPEEVGSFYDWFLEPGAMLFGENLHFGYWTTPGESLAAASERLSDMVIDRLGVRPGDRVLDVGCGVGAPALRLAQVTGAEVVGISVSRRQVDYGNASAAAAGVADRVRFQYADATRLEFEQGSFDAVFALESMIHMPDRGQVLGQAARVLRPGGRLVLTDFFQRAPLREGLAAAMSAGFMEGGFLMTLADRSAYSGWAHAAGLDITEDLDITEHVIRPTYLEIDRMLALGWAAAGVRDVPVAEFGPAGLADMPEIGYLVLTAVRDPA